MEFIKDNVGENGIDAEAILAHIRGDLPALENGKQGEEVECDGAKFLRLTKLDPLKEVKAPPVCISIEVDGKEAVFGTLGNFSLLIGQAKSKKTFVQSMITAAALRNGSIQGVIKCQFPEDKKRVVLFDTEQSNFHVWKVVMRSFQLAGGYKDELSGLIDIHCLRALSPEERVLAIDHYLSVTPNAGLVVIDGIRDLLHDINDSTQANQVAGHLMRWTHDFNVHILTVIHVNKGDGRAGGQARGHIGSELIQKGETIAEVVKDKYDATISTVEARDCRNGKEFETFAFAIDDNGMPQILDAVSSRSSDKPKKPAGPSDITKKLHGAALSKVFEHNTRLMASAFQSAVKMAFAGMGINFGDNAARDFVAYYRMNGMVTVKEKQEGNRTYISLKTEDDSQDES